MGLPCAAPIDPMTSGRASYRRACLFMGGALYGRHMSEQRFVEIETKISHQEFLIEKLNQVIYQQQITIIQLDARLTALIKKFQDTITAENEIGPAGEKPPHY